MLASFPSTRCLQDASPAVQEMLAEPGPAVEEASAPVPALQSSAGLASPVPDAVEWGEQPETPRREHSSSDHGTRKFYVKNTFIHTVDSEEPLSPKDTPSTCSSSSRLLLTEPASFKPRRSLLEEVLEDASSGDVAPGTPDGANTTANYSGMVSPTPTPSPDNATTGYLCLSPGEAPFSASSFNHPAAAISSITNGQLDMTPISSVVPRIPNSWDNGGIPGNANWTIHGNPSHDPSTMYHNGGPTPSWQPSPGAVGLQPPVAAPPTPSSAVLGLPRGSAGPNVLHISQHLVPTPAPHERRHWNGSTVARASPSSDYPSTAAAVMGSASVLRLQLSDMLPTPQGRQQPPLSDLLTTPQGPMSTQPTPQAIRVSILDGLGLDPNVVQPLQPRRLSYGFAP